jgi:hypothetical protein
MRRPIAKAQVMTRWRLQLHLSTLFMVSLLAMGLGWLTVREHGAGPYTMLGDFSFEEGVARGWPSIFEATDLIQPDLLSYQWDWGAFVFDMAICLGVLSLATVAIEWAARRIYATRCEVGGFQKPSAKQSAGVQDRAYNRRVPASLGKIEVVRPSVLAGLRDVTKRKENP